MPVYTTNQQQFIDAFMLQVNDLLQKRLHSAKDEVSFLEALSTSIDTLSAGITLVSLVTAVPTLGASVGIGAACIVLLKTGDAIYQYVRGYINEAKTIDELVDIDHAERRLSLLILLRQTAHLLATRYAHAINDLIEENQLKDFAEFGFVLSIKKLTSILQTNVKQSNKLVFPNTELLVDGLLAIDGFPEFGDNKKIKLKNKIRSFSFFNHAKLPTRALYAQARIAFLNKDQQICWHASHNEGTLHDTALSECGFMMVQNEAYLKERNLAINTSLTPLIEKELQAAIKYLHIEYPVKRHEAEEYLNYIHIHKEPKSLNDFLTEKLGVRIIANCHDDELAGLDLSGGHFSEVNFHHAKLQHCRLENSNWSDAHLEWAEFEGNSLKNTCFKGAYLERSQWISIDFIGDFSNARMCGAKLTDCNLSLTLQQQGCDWELCIRERVTVNHEQILFNHKIEGELSRELQERIQLGIELGKRLDNLSQEVKALQAADQSILNRVNILEEEHNALHIIKRHWETWFNTDTYREAKQIYVELNVSCTIDSITNVIPLGDRLNHFLQSDASFLLVRGEVGSGKTLAAHLFQETLLLNYNNEQTDWVPLYIKLNELALAEENFLLAIFKKFFLESQIYTLHQYRWLIILDGLEECAFSLKQRHLFEECSQFAKAWPANTLKILTLAQTRFLSELEQDHHELLSIAPKVKLPLHFECEIEPLNTFQITQILQKSQLDAKTIKAFKSIQHLFNTPLMLKIVITLLREQTEDEILPKSRAKLYDKFCTNWFAHIQKKLPADSAKESYLQFHIQNLAFEMFEARTYWLDRPYQRERQNRHKEIRDPLSHLFEEKINRVSPLLMTKYENNEGRMILRYKFIHPSFADYALAQKLFNDLLNNEVVLSDHLKNWRYRPLREIPNVLNFLQEFIQECPDKEIIIEILLDMVQASKTPQFNSENAFSSANAMSLLCLLEFDFSGYDLSYIKSPKADLTGALLAFTDLSHSDQTDAWFHKAFALKSNMANTKLKGAQFLNATSFLEMEKPAQTFAVYPYASEIIIAYDVPPDTNYSKAGITIARLSDGTIYQSWFAHSQSILALAWATYEGVARLASAGSGGTIRIWEIRSKDLQPREIAKLNHIKHKCAISHITWFPDGNLLAIYSIDQIVRIWDVNKKTRVFKSLVHSAPVHTLIYGSNTPQLITGSENGHIYMWQAPLIQQEHVQIDLYELLTKNQVGKIYSMALSCDGKQLALGCEYGEILIININDPIASATFKLGHKEKVVSLIWSEHALMSASQDGAIHTWFNKDDVNIYQHDHPINKIELSANGQQLISGGGSQSKHLYTWDITKPQYSHIETELFGNVSCMSSYHSSDNIKHYIAAGFANGSTMVWSIEPTQKSLKKSIVMIVEQINAPVSHVIWSNDGRYLATIGQDKTILAYEMSIPNKLPFATISAKENTRFCDIHWLNIEAHIHHFAVSSSDGYIYIFNCGDLQKSNKHYFDFRDCEMAIHTTLPEQHIPTLSRNTPSFQCLSVAPASFNQTRSWLVSCREQMISLWVLRQASDVTQRITDPVPHPNGNATQLSWSPDGHYFVSSDKDHNIYVWDPIKCICLFFYEQLLPIRSLIWHKQWLVVGTQQNILAWHMPSMPHWNQLPKTISLGTSVLCSHDENLVIAKEQGIYMLNFEQLCTQPLSLAAWRGLIKKALILDQCSLKDVIELSTTTLNYATAHGAVIQKSSTDTNYYQRFLGWIQTKKPPASTATLPSPSPATDLLKRFGICPVPISESERLESSPYAINPILFSAKK